MLMFFAYILPIILLIGSLIIFKVFYVKCTKINDGWFSNVTKEKITFPIWEYVLYICWAIIPVLNWVLFLSLYTLIDDDWFHPSVRRDYWYEIPDVTLNKIADKLCKWIETLLSKKWFLYICSPFVYLYKIMTKRV